MSMKSLLVVLSLAFSLLAWAQTPLAQPLRFVAHEDVLYLTQGSDNLVLRLMAILPFVTPHRVSVSEEEVAPLCQLHLSQPSCQDRSAEEIAKLFLVSGDVRYVVALDSLRHRWMQQLDVDSMQHDAARQLFNTLSWTAATDDRGVFVNFFDDCMLTVRTDSIRFTLDQINEVSRMKYRVSGLPGGRHSFVVRLRLPSPVPERIFLNGRALLAPQIENGYLVLDRRWRNNEEIYYDLTEQG